MVSGLLLTFPNAFPNGSHMSVGKTREREQQWPAVVAEGNVRVKVYKQDRREQGKGLAFHVIDLSGGTRKQRTFASPEEALTEARRVALLMASGQTHALTFSNADAASLGQARALLGGTGVSLEVAASTVAEALKLVDGPSTILEACRIYRESHAGVTACPVEKAVAAMLEAKKAQGASLRYRQDLSSRLGRLAKAFHLDVDSVTTPPLQAWVEGMKLGPQTMRNFRTVLVGFFGFCRSRGWCSGNPAEGLTVPSVQSDEEPEVFSPAEFGRLLRAAGRDFLPSLVLSGFCGLRSAEVERTYWEDVRLASKEVVVRRGTAKTKSRRVVPLPDAAVAWLAGFRNKTGPVWAGSHEGFYDAQKATAAATEVRGEDGRVEVPALGWRPNGLRHGFGSARLAVTGDAVRVAHEMGNSSEMVHRHYKALVGEAAGREWFSIVPGKPANVAEFPAASAQVEKEVAL